MSIAQEKQKVNRKSPQNQKAIENNPKEMFHMESNRGRKKKEVSYDSPFAARLRKLLADTKTTQPMLAEAIGVSRQAIGQWKDGNTLPDVVALGKIADYFNVSADYLLGRSEVMNIDPDKQLNVACNYTGLTEKAVETLHSISQNDENIMQSVTFLLEQYSDKLVDKGECVHKYGNFFFYEIDSVLSEISRYLRVTPSEEMDKMYISEKGKLISEISIESSEAVLPQEIDTKKVIYRMLLDNIEESLKWAKQRYTEIHNNSKDEGDTDNGSNNPQKE